MGVEQSRDSFGLWERDELVVMEIVQSHDSLPAQVPHTLAH